jgi:hypothetical protein
MSAAPDPGPIPMVYILSPGHSGSTLLALLLGAHPSVATVGELKVVQGSFAIGATCSCGARISECPFWRELCSRLERQQLDPRRPSFRTHRDEGWRLFDRVVAGQVRGPLLEAGRRLLLSAWPAAGRHRAHTLRCNVALARAILDVTGRPLLLDASKDASRLRYLRESGLFQIRVLHLLRDGRAVAFSFIRKGLDPAVAAAEWISEHRQAERLRAAWPEGRWRTVHYERLCAQPERELRGICAYLGLAFTPEMTRPRPADAHVLGNRLRLNREVPIALDEAWRGGLTGAARDVVERLTHGLNARFGYASSPAAGGT